MNKCEVCGKTAMYSKATSISTLTIHFFKYPNPDIHYFTNTHYYCQSCAKERIISQLLFNKLRNINSLQSCNGCNYIIVELGIVVES
jgi:hypothetical protein